MSAPLLWAVVGATGTGKTRISLDLAEALAAEGRAAEIVNADAMQLYRGMDIGTAKLPAEERRGIPHRMWDVLAVTEESSAAWYQQRARDAVLAAHERGADAILVGGSGLYVSSVIHRLRFPPRDARLRTRLEQDLAELGPGMLHARLRAADPDAAARIDPRNSRRIVRALEVLAQDGPARADEAARDPSGVWHPRTRIIALHRERADLVAELDARMLRMWREGLLEETAALRSAGLEQGVTARRAIGYAQALAHLDGRMTRDEAVAAAQTLTRAYARRQVSWFRRYRGAQWVDAGAEGAGAGVGSLVAGAEDQRRIPGEPAS